MLSKCLQPCSNLKDEIKIYALSYCVLRNIQKCLVIKMFEIISYTDSLSASLMLQKTSGVFNQHVTFVGLNNTKIKPMEYYPKIQTYVDALVNSKATHVFMVDAFDTILLKTPSVPIYLKDKIVVSSGLVHGLNVMMSCFTGLRTL